MRLGALEIVLILVLALVLLAGKKLSGVGKALGQSIKEFRREMAADDQEKASEPPADQENKG